MTMPDRHEPVPPRWSSVRPPRPREGGAPDAASAAGRKGDAPDPVSLFAVPIGRSTSLADDPLPVTQTLYRTMDGRYVIRTCLHVGEDPALDACDVMIYPGDAELREALSADGDGLDQALLAAAGLSPDGP